MVDNRHATAELRGLSASIVRDGAEAPNKETENR